MNNQTELLTRLHDIKRYLTDKTLIELSGHLTQFLELFIKLYIQNKNPKFEEDLDKELGKLRAIADKIEKLPPQVAFQLDSCQKFRNKIAHNRITDKILWGEDFYDTILSACCSLYSFARSDFTSAGEYVGSSMSILRETYDLSTFSGRRQKEYDDLWRLYDDFFEYVLGDLWDHDGDILSTKEDHEELSDEEEMRLEDIYEVMEIADDMKDILAMVLAKYEGSCFGINHENTFTNKRKEILEKSADYRARMAKTPTETNENLNLQDIILPNQITDDGRWEDGSEIDIPLLGINFSIPDDIRSKTHPESQEIIAISDANSYLQECPNCGEDTSGCLLTTGYTTIYPAKCCNQFCYIVNPSNLSDFDE